MLKKAFNDGFTAALQKFAAMPDWVMPTLGHAVQGAVPGAIVGAVTDSDDRMRGALKGGLTGGALGVGTGQIGMRAKRHNQALEDALKTKGLTMEQHFQQPSDQRLQTYDAAKELVAQRPLFGG